MMLKRLGPTLTELEFADGVRVLVSFETPVAAFLPNGLSHLGEDLGKWVRTDRYVSRTSEEHARAWLAGHKPQTIPHGLICGIIDPV